MLFLLGYSIELVVLRNVPQQSEYTEDLLQWLQDIIILACLERRNVRVSTNNVYNTTTN
jgi:hypothetical protein